MKSLKDLLRCILHDCSLHCDTTTTRDFITITRRIEKEGLPFLGITLPEFDRDFTQSLERGQILPGTFRAFRKVGVIPCLFKGMLLQVFDKNGSLLDEPSINAIRCIRQVCCMWKKIELTCKSERNLAAIEKYIECERDLAKRYAEGGSLYDALYVLQRPSLGPKEPQRWFRYGESRFDSRSPEEAMLEDFGNVSNLLWGNVLGTLAEKLTNLEIIPRHGKGAVAEKISTNQKYDWQQWHQRLEAHFPSDVMCYNSSTAFLESTSKLSYVSPDQEQPVRVVFVPKTLKTPRVIAVEPACMQYTQQALLQDLVSLLETHPLTKGHVNFRDQGINGSLALESSKTKEFATMDLSEASDRVHKELALHMFSTHPILRDAVEACRSSRAVLPTGVTIQLEKFASMGSALCFPVESMVFYTILILSELERRRLSLSLKSVKLVSRSIWVYGDDLIVPADGVELAAFYLEYFGLKVNLNKTFSKGNFRESCGVDAYNGVDVTPSYVRRMLPRSKRDVEGYVSAVALANQLYEKSYMTSSDYLREHLQSIFTTLGVPIVDRPSSYVALVRHDMPVTKQRWCDKLHRSQVMAYVVVPKRKDDQIDGYPALMKWFLTSRREVKNDYQRSVVRGDLSIKRRWCYVE
jgi:hypothetical protein